MSFQSAINYDYGFGIPGEIMRDGPTRAHPGLINSTDATQNVFGRVFTLNGDNKTVGAGGTGAVWGILANPKQHASYGNASGPLAPTFALPNQTLADFVEMGEIVVQLTTAAAIGKQLQFSQTTGALSVPAVAGTPDSGNTLLQAWVENYPQPNANNLALIKIAGSLENVVASSGTE